MRKTLKLYVTFGIAYLFSIFEVFLSSVFDHGNAFSLGRALAAGFVVVLGLKLSQFFGRRLIAQHAGSDIWRLDIRRWILPFILILVVLPFTVALTGQLMRGKPMIGIVVVSVIMLLTPALYASMTTILTRDRLAHVCFSTMLVWVIWLPFFIAERHSLQQWYSAFLWMGSLAVIGYLVAQGLRAIRGKSVIL